MASAAGHNSGLLFLCDTVTKRQFLVDTGAEVSVLPATGLDRRTGQTGPPLLAANGSSIGKYGMRTLSLHFASNSYQWKFVIAEVSRPLLGADFLRSNSLLVDVKGKRLVDAVSYHSVPLSSTRGRTTHCRELSLMMCNWVLTMVPWPRPNNRMLRYKPIVLLHRASNWKTSPLEHKVLHFSVICLLAMLDQLYLLVGDIEFLTRSTGSLNPQCTLHESSSP